MTPVVALRATRPRESDLPVVHAPAGGFGQDLLDALGRWPRAISPKYFYDARGSALFDAICDLPEYYPTRTELGILRRHAGEIAAQIGPQADIVEYGAGSLRKVRLLLDAADRPARFVPVDISGEHLTQAAAALRADYPGLAVEPVNKVAQGQPHIVDAMIDGEIDLVFNTTEGWQSMVDSKSIRATALLMKIPYYTTAAASVAAAEAIRLVDPAQLDVRSLQDSYS